MKKLLLPTIVILFCSACKSHIYFIKSNTAISNDSAFSYENDTVKITYNLWVNKGKMEFSIFNKLNIPIFIDWKNSSFILNDVPEPYWIDKTETRSRSTGVYYKGLASGASTGTMVKEDRVTMIPPKSKIKKVRDKYLCKFETYTHEDVRKKFRNFIAYSTSEDIQVERFVDNEFEVVEVRKVGESKIDKYKAPIRYYTHR